MLHSPKARAAKRLRGRAEQASSDTTEAIGFSVLPSLRESQPQRGEAMLANIKGLVERLDLTPAKAMMPLFEGVSNAIDAIEEHGDGFFKHAIRIRLVAGRDLAHQGGDETLLIDGFDITDDGVGFHDQNLASFKEAHTLSKVKLGGKGVGRFSDRVPSRGVTPQPGQADVHTVLSAARLAGEPEQYR
jgi:hypothetical protein